jgi:cell wall-associated NlpC family hydrolase
MARVRANTTPKQEGSGTLTNNGLRWARVCLAVMMTALLTLSCLTTVEASRKSKSKKDSSRSSSTSKRTRSERSSSSKSSKRRKGPVIKGDNVSLRTGPGENKKRITLTDINTRVKVLNRRKGWVQVRLPNGNEGWLRGDFVAGVRASSSGSASSRKARTSSSRRSSSKRVASAKKNSASAKKRNAATPDRRGKRMARVEPVRVARNTDEVEATDDIVRTAYSYRGTPYRFGSMSGRTFDCSGFTSFLFRKQGIKLPRTASEQFHAGQKVSREDLQPGDLVFFHTTRSGISHVGMYVGDGKFVHASSRGGVRVDPLDSGYYNNRYRGAARYQK